MYRPTVRYPDAFKDYVDDLFRKTKLDRNQIFRLALFSAAYSREFHDILKKHSFHDVHPPSPTWALHEDTLWKGTHYSGSTLKKAPVSTREVVKTGAVMKFKDNGGIKITLS